MPADPDVFTIVHEKPGATADTNCPWSEFAEARGYRNKTAQKKTIATIATALALGAAMGEGARRG